MSIRVTTTKVEFCSKDLVSSEDNAFTFQFWDIGGQERYIYMTHVYYKNADFCLIMFDLMSRDSFRACAKWKKDLDDKYRMEDGSKCPCLLIGNKVIYTLIHIPNRFLFGFLNFLYISPRPTCPIIEWRTNLTSRTFVGNMVCCLNVYTFFGNK